MKIRNWLKNTYRGGEPVRHYAIARWHNRVANVLQDIEGEGCFILKPTDKEGRGWKIVVGEPDSINARWAFEVIGELPASEESAGTLEVLPGFVVWVNEGVYPFSGDDGLAFTGGTEESPQYLWVEFVYDTEEITIEIGSSYPSSTDAIYRQVLVAGYKDASDNQIVTKIHHKGDIYIFSADGLDVRGTPGEGKMPVLRGYDEENELVDFGDPYEYLHLTWDVPRITQYE